MGFSKSIKALDSARTFRIPLDIPSKGEPALIVKHAGHGNDGYINADYKKASPGGPQSAARDRMEREIEAPIFAEHVVVGWEHIYEDDSATPCEFSRAKAEEFLLALARDRPDQFYIVRALSRMSSNFRETAVDAAALGKK